MILLENRLPADDSHEISCLICYFRKSGKILNCFLLQIIGGALWVKILLLFQERRQEKKMNRKAFTSEKIRQDKEIINVNHNLKGVKIV